MASEAKGCGFDPRRVQWIFAESLAMDKKFNIIKKRLDLLEKDMDEDEKILTAKCLAATPTERWLMNQDFLRWLKIYEQSPQKAGRNKMHMTRLKLSGLSAKALLKKD